MNSALVGTDPVIFFESQRVYDTPELFHGAEGVPAGYYEVPLGEPDIKKEGSDLTILTVGATLYRALDAAKILEEQHNLSCEVIDARSIVPFDYAKVLESVKKTGAFCSPPMPWSAATSCKRWLPGSPCSPSTT
jgi:2-oxoisovalerate dehydrogenase E1 component